MTGEYITPARKRRALLSSTALQAAALLLAAAMVPGAATAQPAPNAQPTGGRVSAGAASIGQTATATTITQSSPRAAIDWNSFDVGRNQTVQFNQPSATAITLNRVNSPDPSAIAGRITANGQLIITNPSGVVFHQGAQVDAASLVVSAPGITNQNFMAGRMVFDQPARPDAQVSNAGRITVRDTGLVGLVAPRVANSGTITARMGHVVLAGAEAHTVDLYGDGLLSIDVTQQVSRAPRGPDGKPVTALVTNTGTVIADGGTITLTASAADGIVQTLVDAGGRLQANAAGGRAGTVVIAGIGGDVRVGGRVAADSRDGQGGTVVLNTTGALTVAGTARVTANGATGGGTVAVGTTLARATGGPSIRNQPTAATTTVEPGARISANARTAGNGGNVTVLSRANTVMAGRLEAKGGLQGGNGGAIEVSGDILSLIGPVSTAAPRGRAGSVLLDPADYLITSAQPDGPNSITPTTLQNMNASVVTVSTTGNLIAASSVSLPMTTTGQPESLQLSAGGALTVNAGVTLQATGSVSLTAGAAGISLLGSVTALGNGTYRGDVSSTIAYQGIVLNTPGDVTQGPGSALIASNLSGTVGSATLTSRLNQITTVGKDGLTFEATAGSIALTDSVNLTVGGGNTVGGGANGIVVPDSSNGPLRTIALVTDSLTLNALNGTPIYAPNGTFALAPFTAGTVGMEVSTTGVKTPGTLSLTTNDLNNITAANLSLGSSTTKSVTFGTSATQIDFGSYGFETLAATAAGPVAAYQTGTAPAISYASIGIGSFSGAGSSLSLPGDNVIPVLAGFATPAATPGPIAFHTSGNLTVTGPVNGSDVTLSASGTFVSNQAQVPPTETVNILANITATGTLRLDTTNGTSGAALPVVQDSETVITAGILTGAVGPATLVGANHIAQIGGFTSEGAVVLSNAQSLAFNGTVSATTFQMNVTGDVTQPGGSLSTGTLSGSANSLALTQPTNAIYQIGTFATDQGGFALATTLTFALSNTAPIQRPLTVIGALSVPNGQTVNLTANRITIAGGSIAAPAGTVIVQPLTVGRGTELVGTTTDTTRLSLQQTDLNAISAATLQLGNDAYTGNIVIGHAADALTLTGIATLQLRGNGTVTEGAGASVDVTNLGAGSLVTPAASITLDGPNQIGHLVGLYATGAVVVTNAATLSVAGDISGSGVTLTTTNAGALTLDSGTIATGSLALSIAGDVTQTEGVIDVTSLTGSAGTLSLTNPSNSIAQLGPFTTTGLLAVTDSQSLTIAGPISGGDVTLNVLMGDLNITRSLAGGTVTLNVPNGDISESGTISAALLTGTALSASLNQNNDVSTLGNFTTTNGFRLDNFDTLAITGNVTDGANIEIISQGNITVSGQVAAPVVTLTAQADSGTVDIVQSGGLINASQLFLYASGDIRQTGGSIVADALSGESGGITSLVSTTNVIGSLASFDSTGGFALVDSITLTVTGPVTDTASIGLTSAAGLVLDGDVTAPAVTLSAVGTITQTDGVIAASGTLGGNGSTVSLTGANQVAALAAFTATGDFSFADTQALSLAGAVSAGTGRTLSLAADSIQFQTGGSLSAPGGTVALAPYTAAAAFSVSSLLPTGTANAVSASTLRLGSASSGLVTIDGAFNLPNVTTLDLQSGAGVTETAAGTLGVNTLTGTITGPANLGSANTIGTLGAFSSQGGLVLRDMQALTVAGPVTDTASIGLTVMGALALGGSVTAPAVTLTAGDITQTAGVLTVTGTLTGSGGSVTLGQAANRIANLGAFAATGDFALADGQTLNVTGPVSAGTGHTVSLASDTIQLQTGGGLSAPGGTVALAPLSTGQAFTLANLGPSTPAITAATLRVGSPSSGLLTINGSFTLPNVTTLDLRSGAGVTEGTAAAIAVNTLTGTVTGSASLGNANAVTNLGAFTATGDFTLTNAQPLNVTGQSVAGTGRTLSLIADAIQLQPGGGLSAAGGTVALAPYTTGGFFSLSSFVPAGTAAVVTASTLRVGSLSSGLVTIDGPFSLPNVTTLDLRSATGVTETAAGSIAVRTLTGTVGGNTVLRGANAIATLGTFTAGGGIDLVTTSALAVSGAVTANGTIALSSGDLRIGPALTLPGSLATPGTVSLTSTGAITEPNGTIRAGTLTGSATSTTLTGSNTIQTLDAFTSSVSFTLNDLSSITVTGPVTSSNMTIASSGDIGLAGDVAAGQLLLNAGGTIQQTSGTLVAQNLSGSANHLASFGDTGGEGTASINTLGSFTLVGSTLTLLDSVPLTVTGPLTSGTITLSAPGSLTLAGGTIATDNATFTAASGGQLVQTGSTIVRPIAASTGDVTLSGGQVTLGNLLASNEGVSIILGTGSASGNLTAADLFVSGSGGGTNLTGQVAGQTGFGAAYVSSIAPAFDLAYRINACAIASVSCVPVQTLNTTTTTTTTTTTVTTITTTTTVEITVEPTTPAEPLIILSELTPKSFYDTLLGATLKTNLFTTDLITLAIARDATDPNLVLPNISDRDY